MKQLSNTGRWELRRIIEESGYKQVFIAKKMGIHPTQLTKILRGYRPMYLSDREQILDIVGYQPEEV